MKTKQTFVVLIILAVIIIGCQFICRKYSAEISSVASALSLIVSAFAYRKSERNSAGLDEALKLKEGEKVRWMILPWMAGLSSIARWRCSFSIIVK